MLLELSVENYAVVDRLNAQFYEGLNLLTGETGSGKSIVVDAFGLLLGARASSDAIRSGEARARVSGRFDICPDTVRSVLEPAGLETDDGELLIEREILANGKSRAYVGNRPVTAALLRDLAPLLGDIHGQHDQQLLFSPAAQMEMLDAFGRLEALRQNAGQAFRKLRTIESQLQSIESDEREKLRLLDVWEFQRKEIEAAAPKIGEDSALEDERRVQSNLGRLTENAEAAFGALYDAPESAYAGLRTAMKRLDELARIDSSLGGIRQTLEPAVIAIQEGSYALRDYLSHLEANPGRLEEIESRMAVLEKLKRKYGGTLDSVLAFLEEVRASIAGLETAGERAEALRRDKHKLSAQFETIARELTARRRDAAQDLSSRVEAELASLAMERTVFRIEITEAPWSENGADEVQFLVSPNLGEEPRPLEKVASGGELSRIALAIKTCLVSSVAVAGPRRTLVFDEIDAGIGGRAAEGVARRLKRLASSNQVLCVTHLAQIACFADHHYRVEKQESNGRTVARMEHLEGSARTREVGRMLSGHKLTPEALKNAEQLIRMSSRA